MNQNISRVKKVRISFGDFVVENEAEPEQRAVKRAWLRAECLIEGVWLTKIDQPRAKAIDVPILNDLRLVVVNERIRQRRKIEDRGP